MTDTPRETQDGGDPAVVPAWPGIVAVVRDDGSAEVTVAGTSHPVLADSVDEARAAVRERIRGEAERLGRPVRVDARDPDGQWQLVVAPSGDVREAADPQRPRRWGSAAHPLARSRGRPPQASPARPAAGSEPAGGAVPVSDVAPGDGRGGPVGPAGQAGSAAPTGAAPEGPARSSTPTLDDLLATRPPPQQGPATLGWRGSMSRLSGGLVKPAPGPAEVARREAVAAVQRSLDGPKTVVVVNPKGGAHKTTATLLIAATFGIHRGGYVLAWDNNETRGTLGWRANPARHSSTAVTLLRDLDRFTHAGALVGDLDNYVRSQGSAQFHVLASDEDAAGAASVDAEAFQRLHSTLSRFYRVLVVDTGNNMRASNWQAAVDVADQLVVVSTVREDTAQSAAWLVDALRASGQAAAVRQAVTILAAPTRAPDAKLARRLHDHFGRLTRAVLDVPYDPSLVAGGPISYDALTTASREAWLRVAAEVADGL